MAQSSILRSQSSRRAFLKGSIAAAATLASSQPLVAAADSELEVISIGSRRELFVDRYLIDKLVGDAEQRLHHPVPREIALVHDASWEGTGSGYHTIFQDGDRYRMYYKAWHLEVSQGKMDMERHPLFCCYAESDDGIVWRKPMLGLYEFEGSKQNNICMVSGPLGALNVDAGHPAVFKDENPNVPADARYKAIFRSGIYKSDSGGLLPFKSADGLRWTPMTDATVLDGFVSAAAPRSGGEVLTKPLVFDGDELTVNFSTSAAGSIQVEIQEMDGKPVEGFALADCPPVFGDSIDRIISWKNGADVRKLAGRPVRLRWVLQDADLYAFQFIPIEQSRPE